MLFEKMCDFILLKNNLNRLCCEVIPIQECLVLLKSIMSKQKQKQ